MTAGQPLPILPALVVKKASNTRTTLWGSLALGPTTAAHLSQEAARQYEADAERHEERDEGTVNPIGMEQPSANRQDGHDPGCNLPRIADDEVVPESREPDEEAHVVP
jgi:hypothetical protein